MPAWGIIYHGHIVAEIMLADKRQALQLQAHSLTYLAFLPKAQQNPEYDYAEMKHM